MANKSGRFFAGFGAALFLVTSSALTVGVILTLNQSNNSTSTTNSSTGASGTTSTPSSTNIDPAGSYSVGHKLPGYTPLNKPLAQLELYDLVKGTGASVSAGSTVTADYVGALADSGIVFDDSSAHGGAQTFSLNGVIKGWSLGIPGMKVGGVREIMIPAGLGYGSQSVSGIPANSDLVFWVRITAAK